MEAKMKRNREEHEVQHGGDGLGWFRGALIGKGSFGSVYLATLKKRKSRFGCLPEVMAVKSAEVSISGSIQKEREALNNIGRCSNIIRCFGEEITTGENGAMMYNLLLEYGSGGTLADLIKKSGGSGLPESDVRHYTRSILRGLYHIHERGYVHCDLKPENILLVPNTICAGTKFQVKIGDFGLAKRAKLSKKRKLDLDPYLRGTPMYLSPEAVVENVQEPPSDVWAVGCIVLEMLTGKPPWDEMQDLDAKVLLQRISEGYELPNIPSGISKEGREFLKGCFARKSMYRLTAEMLLHHSFVEGLVDDDGEIEDVEEISDGDVVGLSWLLHEADEYGYSSLSDDCGFLSEEEFCLSSWSEDEEESGSQGLSISTEEGILEGQSSLDTSGSITTPALDGVISKSDQVSTNTMQQCPITLTIPAGL